MQFFKNVLATIVGLFLFCFLFFIIIVFVGVIAGGSGKEDVVTVEDNSVIELDLSEVTEDYSGKFIFTDFEMLNSEPHKGLSDVLKAIETAKKDDKIKGITITNSTSLLGIAQSKALRDKLEEFKKSGKFVMAYSDSYSQRDYYINSVADTLYLNPVGDLDFKGLSLEVMFYKELQEKTGITMEVIRHGKYKSAVEPFLANEMSPANREQLTVLLNAEWDTFVTDISKSRKISTDSLNSIANRLGARNAELAKQTGLIDKIGYKDQYISGIKKALKVKKDEEYNTVEILDYVKAHALDDLLADAKDEVAVIYAQGEIAGGDGDVDVIGEKAITDAFHAALDNESVKAIVLRVNSPGGSALTSELIWRQVELAKKQKPVIVSMGNYAASGGYYISCGANRIFTEPGTITGSIGVFGVLPNFTKLSNNIGVHTETVSTHDNAAGYSVFTPLDDKTREVLTKGVEDIYTTFVNRVATGRKMTPEAVDAIAQGRVWVGTDAVKLGLADEIGSLDDAVKYAAKMGKTDDYSVKNYPEYERSIEDLINRLAGFPVVSAKEDMIREEVGEENYQVIQRIRRVTKLRGTQAVMPFEITIQ
ncbi:signal peptide peptidase SppA [Flavobacterium rhizosphaerae]|uniref:Signal peptide peptidase SppA n=1 Tax=Flavobacterium rhizosphaerae TaxID=3163298 RepID=A0ABW8YZ82_9FLAO